MRAPVVLTLVFLALLIGFGLGNWWAQPISGENAAPGTTASAPAPGTPAAPAAPATPNPGTVAVEPGVDAPSVRIEPSLPDTQAAEAAALAQLPSDRATKVQANGPQLSLPIANVKPADVHDMFDQKRGEERRHEAIDIMAPRGTPVLAVDDGTVRKLFTSKPGGLTIYQFDPTETYAYYYAHLDRYADNLKEGQKVRRGQVIGYVGTTGNSDPNTPHLHFALLLLGADKNWYKTTAINPYPYFANALNRR